MAAPLAWAVELFTNAHGPSDLIAFWVPVATSAAFLLLLVVRLGLIARVAQRQAEELAQRSTALAAAVSGQEELQQQLAYRALHDPLTGLPNRTVLAERLENLLANPADVDATRCSCSTWTASRTSTTPWATPR